LSIYRPEKSSSVMAELIAIRLLQQPIFDQALQDVLKQIRLEVNAGGAILYLAGRDVEKIGQGEGEADPANCIVGDPEGTRTLLSESTLQCLRKEAGQSDVVTQYTYEAGSASGLSGEILAAGDYSAMVLITLPVRKDYSGFLLLMFGEDHPGLEDVVIQDLKAAAELITSAAIRDQYLKRLQSRSRSFLRLNTLTRTALEASDLPGLLDILSIELKQMVSADECEVYLYSSSMPAQVISDSSTGNHHKPGVYIVQVEDIPQKMSDLQTVRVFQDLHLEKNKKNDIREEIPCKNKTLLVLPILDAKEKYGVVVLYFNQPRKFTIEELTLCDQAVSQTALGLTRTGLLNRLEKQVEKRTKKLEDALQMMKEENTVRSKAEIQMRISEERLRSITQSAPLGIVMLDEAGKIELWNPAAERIFGYSQDVILGESIGKILVERSHSQFWEYISQKYQLGQELGTGILCLEGVSASGERIPLELSAGSWEKDAGRFYAVLIRDISQEQEIRRWADRQGQFAFVGKLASGVAQDFSTILSAIILYAELLENSEHLTEKDHNYVDMILQQSKRAAGLSTQILELERTPTEIQKPLDLIPFLERVFRLLERILPEKTTFKLVHGSEDYTISVDENRLRQILLDLAFAVREKLPEESGLEFLLDRIHVRMESEKGQTLDPGEWVLVKICGILPDKGTEFSFTPDNHLKEGNLMGPGFPQLESIVERQNGVLEQTVDSDGKPGFVLNFPALTISENLEGSQDNEQPVRYFGDQPVILIVEDEDVSRAAVREILEKQGYSVMESNNGQHALDLIRSKHIDLLLTDVIMPEMGGIALVNQVHKEFEHVEVLIMSGYPLGDGPGELLHSEGVRWLKKPISTSTLTRATAEALNRRFAADR